MSGFDGSITINQIDLYRLIEKKDVQLKIHTNYFFWKPIFKADPVDSLPFVDFYSNIFIFDFRGNILILMITTAAQNCLIDDAIN